MHLAVFCLSLLRAGIMGLHHHAWLLTHSRIQGYEPSVKFRMFQFFQFHPHNLATCCLHSSQHSHPLSWRLPVLVCRVVLWRGRGLRHARSSVLDTGLLLHLRRCSPRFIFVLGHVPAVKLLGRVAASEVPIRVLWAVALSKLPRCRVLPFHVGTHPQAWPRRCRREAHCGNPCLAPSTRGSGPP